MERGCSDDPDSGSNVELNSNVVTDQTNVTLAMIQDAAIQVAMMKIARAQASFAQTMSSIASRATAFAKGTTDYAEKLADEAVVMAADLQVKMRIKSKEASDAIIQYRDKLMEEAALKVEAARIALAEAKDLTKGEMEKLREQLHDVEEGLGRITARAAAMTMLAASIIIECFEETQQFIISTSQELLDALQFACDVSIAKLIQIRDDALKKIQEKIARDSAARAIRRAKIKAQIEAYKQEMSSKWQEAKNDIYARLLNELEAEINPDINVSAVTEKEEQIELLSSDSNIESAEFKHAESVNQL